jgi:hypothetical protein
MDAGVESAQTSRVLIGGRKYAHVQFIGSAEASAEEVCRDALASLMAGGGPTLEGHKLTVTKRPLVGATIFNAQRPFFAKEAVLPANVLNPSQGKSANP